MGTKLSLNLSVTFAMVVGLGGLLWSMERYTQLCLRRIEIASARCAASARVRAGLHLQYQTIGRLLFTGDQAEQTDLQKHQVAFGAALSHWGHLIQEQGSIHSDTAHRAEPNDIDRLVQIKGRYQRLGNEWQTWIGTPAPTESEQIVSRYKQQRSLFTELDHAIAEMHRDEVADRNRLQSTLARGFQRRVHEVLLLILVALGFILLLWRMVVHLITGPIQRLQNAMKTLAQTGHSARLPRDISDEIEDWVHSFESIVEELSSTMTSVNRLRHEVQVRKQAQTRLSRMRHRLRSLASELSLVEERERRRVAAGLHDHICQKLVLSKLNMQFLRRRLDSDSLFQIIDQQCRLLDEMIAEARTLTFELGNPLLHEVGLDAALDSWLRRNVQDRLGLRCELISECKGFKPAEYVRVYLYRAVCELVTNTVKHAQAQRVTVRVSQRQGDILIVVQDDGIGFDVATVLAEHREDKGFGLFSVSERVAYLGGTLSVKSKSGQGTRITLRIPGSLVTGSIQDSLVTKSTVPASKQTTANGES